MVNTSPHQECGRSSDRVIRRDRNLSEGELPGFYDNQGNTKQGVNTILSTTVSELALISFCVRGYVHLGSNGHLEYGFCSNVRDRNEYSYTAAFSCHHDCGKFRNHVGVRYRYKPPTTIPGPTWSTLCKARHDPGAASTRYD